MTIKSCLPFYRLRNVELLYSTSCTTQKYWLCRTFEPYNCTNYSCSSMQKTFQHENLLLNWHISCQHAWTCSPLQLDRRVVTQNETTTRPNYWEKHDWAIWKQYVGENEKERIMACNYDWVHTNPEFTRSDIVHKSGWHCWTQHYPY